MAEKGVLAQLVERFNGIEEVSGSTPLHSTFSSELQVIRHPDSGWLQNPIFPGHSVFSGDNILDHVAVYIGEAEAAALELVGQALVVDACKV